MTTLQRSATSFRRQGSSGRIWEDNYLTSGSSESQNPRIIQESRFGRELGNAEAMVNRQCSDPSRMRKVEQSSYCLAFLRPCCGSPGS